MVDVQAQEVVGLEQHVGELREGKPHVVAIQTALDRILGHHLIDGEMLAHVAQKVGQRHGGEPFGVVEEQGLGLSGARREVEETAQLLANSFDIGVELLPA